MIDVVKVGTKISALRKSANMTQDDLADKLFITRQALSKWENGLGFPQIESIFELTKIFNISIEELLCMNEQPISETINYDNIFSGHSRQYIIDSIINSKLQIDLSKYFYQFSDNERMQILKAIKEEKLFVRNDEMEDLVKKLTRAELKYIGRIKEVIYEIEENCH